jgi:hypothetical protein
MPAVRAELQNCQLWSLTAIRRKPARTAPNGYLEPSVSTPRLTRTSAALTCSRSNVSYRGSALQACFMLAGRFMGLDAPLT